MNLPPILDRKSLESLAAPDEHTAIRVVLLKTNNAGPYRLRCRVRQYVFERDGTLAQHVLVIPLSVWMANIPAGPYRQNTSVCHDMMPTVATPFVIQVIPWVGRKPLSNDAESIQKSGIDPALLPALSGFFEKIGAPPIVKEILGIMEKVSLEEFQSFLDAVDIQDESDEDESDPVSSPTTQAPEIDQTKKRSDKVLSNDPAAVRMREMRARKKAEKAAAAKELIKKTPRKIRKDKLAIA